MSSSDARVVLTFATGPRAAQRVEVTADTVLGRENCDVMIADQEVSRRHAIVRKLKRGFEVEDLRSLNGTLLNDVALAGPTPLRDGDVLTIGQSRIEVAVQAEAASFQVSAVHSGSDQVGSTLGRYELVEVLSRDEMFTIYKAWQESLDRFVAVKVLAHPQDEQFATRFKLEARILARLHHPNIVSIYDSGEERGLLFIVTQYIDSEVMLNEMVGQPMDPARALALVAQVLRALDHAHSKGVVHRNVKPANILLALPTWPMLAGFDIAKLVDQRAQDQLTRHGMIIGTPAYMSPEQVFGLKVDARSDVYATGVLLYELLTGRVPFQEDTPQATLNKHAYELPPPARALNPSLPPDVEPLLSRALAKEPHHRYGTASEAAEALEQLADRLERSRASDPLTELYREGVHAFEQGRWDLAVKRLDRLVALDPDFEDAAALLEMAVSQARRG
jgi:tetratricopeptide (TPR) repeat protein